jgi:hypothetical protein
VQLKRTSPAAEVTRRRGSGQRGTERVCLSPGGA